MEVVIDASIVWWKGLLYDIVMVSWWYHGWMICLWSTSVVCKRTDWTIWTQQCAIWTLFYTLQQLDSMKGKEMGLWFAPFMVVVGGEVVCFVDDEKWPRMKSLQWGGNPPLLDICRDIFRYILDVGFLHRTSYIVPLTQTETEDVNGWCRHGTSKMCARFHALCVRSHALCKQIYGFLLYVPRIMRSHAFCKQDCRFLLWAGLPTQPYH